MLQSDLSLSDRPPRAIQGIIAYIIQGFFVKMRLLNRHAQILENKSLRETSQAKLKEAYKL